MSIIQSLLTTLARLISSLVPRLWNGGCLGRGTLGLLALFLVGFCAAPFGNRSAQQGQQPAAAASTAAALMPANYTPQPTLPGGEVLPTWTPAPPATEVVPPTAAEPATAPPVPTAQPGSSQLVPAGAQKATVVDTIDGDTIDVEIDGQVERVRFIGIDTPETRHPSKGVECYGKEASARTAELLAGKTVYLEEDQSQDSRDRYGRILRYIWMEDGTLFNQQLVAEGYAFEYTYETPYKYQSNFKAAQASAREQGLGLWSPTTCNGEQKPASSTEGIVNPTAQPAELPAPSAEVAAPTAPPAPVAGPLAPSFNGCGAEPNAEQAPNVPVRIVEVDKREETVTLQNVSDQVVDLAGWRMCSIRGSQLHDIGGTLAPGETKVYPHGGGNIWNNSETDDGALYDGEGRLVSYWDE